MTILGMTIPQTLSAKQNTPKYWTKVMKKIAKHYARKDMANCDYTTGRTVDDLNALNFLFNDCIPQLAWFGTLSRHSALYQDSKPFFNQDVSYSIDTMNSPKAKVDVFTLLNDIMHHDMKLFFKNAKRAHRKRQKLQGNVTQVFADVIELMKRQISDDKKHGYNENSLQSYDMKKTNLDYAHWLNSYVSTTDGSRLISDLIGELTDHYLDTNDAVYLETGTEQGSVPHMAITEFCGDPNGSHYLKTYSHKEFLDLLEDTLAQLTEILAM